MPHWLKSLDGHVGRASDWWMVCGPGGFVVWAVMSLAGHGIAWIAQYGWGAAIYIGFAAACVFMLVSSAFLTIWRKFRPYNPRHGDKAGTVTTPSSEVHNLDKAIHVSRIHLDMDQVHNGSIKLEITLFNATSFELSVIGVNGEMDFFGVVGGEGKFVEKLPPPGAEEGFEMGLRAWEERKLTLFQSVGPSTVKAIVGAFSEGKGVWFHLNNLDLYAVLGQPPAGRRRVALWEGVECHPGGPSTRTLRYVSPYGSFPWKGPGTLKMSEPEPDL